MLYIPAKVSQSVRQALVYLQEEQSKQWFLTLKISTLPGGLNNTYFATWTIIIYYSLYLQCVGHHMLQVHHCIGDNAKSITILHLPFTDLILRGTNDLQQCKVLRVQVHSISLLDMCSKHSVAKHDLSNS